MIELSKRPTRAPAEGDKSEIKKEFKKIRKRLGELQNLLYANDRHSLLIILQGLDAAGKDSTIKHVFSRVNPTGLKVKSFQVPTKEERSHDFLWRIYQNLPATGKIHIFNRSHYEDILVPTVKGTLDAETLTHRYDYIDNFEQHLQQQGTVILKYFLNLSEEKQDKKLAKRFTDPRKKWKYDAADKKARKNRSDYLAVYEDIFTRCSSEIPWEIIPADQKWYRNFCVAESVVKKLEALNMSYPDLKHCSRL